MKKLVSIIVPFYNARKYLEQSVNALLSQSLPQSDYEVVLIDNNSNDGSTDIVQKYSSIRYLFEKKQGAYAARNLGIASTSSDILAFTDPDCIVAPDWLERLIEAFQDTEVGIVLGRRLFASDSMSLALISAYEATKVSFVSSGNSGETCFGYTNNMGVRRGLFGELGLFLEIPRGADTIFVRSAIEKYSLSVVMYSSGVWVRHLEIDSLAEYYRKQPVWGRNNEYNRNISSFRPLYNKERLRLFYRTVQESHYSFFKSISLFLLLCVGGVCYEIGRLQAILRQKFGLKKL